jgi:general secretion pathway protein H
MGADARDRTGGSLTCAMFGRRTWARGGIARSSAAFTLIEILLAIALLGLLSAAMVSVAGHLADGRPKSPQEVFWEATRVARRTALKTETQVRLSYDAKAKAFVLDAKEGARNFPVPEIRDLTIDFLQAQSTGGSLLIGGQLVDTQTIPAVSFFPDGTCTPFRVQFRTNGPAQIVAIDPWTCAPVLGEPKKT